MMTEKIRETFKDNEKVKITAYDDLTANAAIANEANFLLRGLRNTTDFEYENTISQVNRHLVGGLETVFLITSPELAPISSTIVRELHKYGAKVDDYLPYDLD
jgi:pantetheine-phosphate adenylyltransferase